MEAESFLIAVMAAGSMGINPGGEVVGADVGGERPVPEEFRWKLLDKPQVARAFQAIAPGERGECRSIGEWERDHGRTLADPPTMQRKPEDP